jgi:YVTN family beta-propeller protein
MPRAHSVPMWAGLLAVLDLLFLIPMGTAAEIHSVASTPPPGVARLRSPVALALAERGSLLLSANQRSGTVSIVDLKAAHVVAEVPIGKAPSDLVAVSGPDEGYFLVTDWATNQLHLLLLRRGGELTVVDSLQVSPFPASVCCDTNGKRCFVASLWSRKLTVVDLERGPDKSRRLKTATTIPLPFAPRLQALCPDGRILVVADAFGGNLAVINRAESRIQAVKTIPGHNIRGLAWNPDGRRLVVSHQTLSRLAYTTAEDIHWGSVVSNVLRSLSRNAVGDATEDVLAHSRLFQLGDVGKGAGDPAALALTQDGSFYVALAGVGQIAAGHLETADSNRLPVGIRPTALVASGDGSTLYIADTFGDSIAIVKWNLHTKANYYHTNVGEPLRISLGPQPPLSAADRGERLFFDARLSHENWMSCHSCHPDGQSSDQLSDTLGDGSFGAAKRIPSLGGVAQTGPWAWNGSMRDLPDQIRKSALTTMHAKSMSEDQVRDLTEYLKTLQPAPPAVAPTDAAAQSAIDRGRAVFERHGCDGCHVPPTYTSPKTYDVGLRDEMGNTRFNPPSLRGVGQRAAWFHDGRADSLEAVFLTHRHPGKTDLSADERSDLLAFLRSL